MSGFTISILAGKDKASSSVQVEGSVKHIITDEERATFGLSDLQLKQATAKYPFFNGQQPDAAYLHNPTPPYGNNYGDWPQVQTTLVYSSAEILGITSKPVALKTQTFTNDSSEPATFTVSISDSVSETASSNWSTGGTLTVGQKISYKIGFLGSGAGGETSLSYSQSWGIGGSNSKTVTVGSQSSVSVTIPPNKAIIASLSASRGVMTVRIRYNAFLTGYTYAYYKKEYKGYHSWGTPLPAIMANSDIPNSIESTEDIEIGYYSDSKIEIKDADTNEFLSTHFLSESIPGLAVQ